MERNVNLRTFVRAQMRNYKILQALKTADAETHSVQ